MNARSSTHKTRSSKLKNVEMVITDPPAHLSPWAREWFRRVVREYGITDESGIMLLTGALENFDRARAAREVIEREGMFIDVAGSPRAHPALTVENRAYTLALSYWKHLQLDIEPLRSGPGRPPKPPR
jgi:phage terminase small subunit